MLTIDLVSSLGRHAQFHSSTIAVLWALHIAYCNYLIIHKKFTVVHLINLCKTF